jgi:uncharacterized repeat protein (TIGR03806 family)
MYCEMDICICLLESSMERIAILSMILLLVACTGGDSSAPAAPPSPALSGLDARPANPTCVAPARPLQNVSYALTDAFPGVIFNKPVLVLQAPGETGRMFVVEQTGRIFTVNLSGTPVKTLFADLHNSVDSGSNEAGLLGMAFHPAYASNGLVFLSYTTSDNPVAENGANLRSRISRFNATSDYSSLDMASERNLITLAQPYPNHNGGNIVFHPTEGYLYIGFGDGGSGGDPENRAQNSMSMFGKMLRIDVNVSDSEWSAGTHYKIPAGNPYVAGGQGLAEIYALGLRNPWRWSFDRQTGELWAGDVGQDAWEEIDKIVVGGNYGWRQREGAHCYNPASGCLTTGLIDPVVEYAHSSGRCSVTGGYVYRGNSLSALRGQYLYGDYCTGEIWAIPTATANPAPQLLLDSPYTYMISAFGEDAAGEIYVVNHSIGIVHRLVASGGTPGGLAVPAQLAQTGCVASGNPTQAVAGLVPYDINVPFWSDGLAKERYLSVPDGSSIARTSEGRFEFPVGSVLMKNFRQNGTLIETRLLMHHPDGVWAGYSYEWNAFQTDATLVTTTTTKLVNGQSWTFLESADCMRCHTDSAVFALGTEISQLNRNFTYPGTGRTRNQLATLEAVGLFSAALPASPANLAALPSPSDAAHTLTERARSYLHANCSNCHRPGVGTPASIDLRYDTTLASSGACAPPILGNLGVPGANIITPGNPASSVLYLRMSTRGANQMPPLASALVDTDGAALIAGWIQSMSSCP